MNRLFLCPRGIRPLEMRLNAHTGYRTAVFSAFLGTALAAYAMISFPAVVLRMAAEFSVDPKMLAQSQIFLYLFYVIALIGGGVLSDRIGRKPVFIFCSISHVVGAALMAGAGSFAGTCAANVFLGMGNGILQGMGTALIGDLFPHRRKMVMNLSQVTFCVGAVGGPALIGWLMPLGVSWRWFFWALAAADVVMGTLFAAGRMPRPGAVQSAGEPTATPEAASAPGGVAIRGALDVFAHGSVWLGCALLTLYVAIESSVVIFMNDYLQTCLAAPETWAVSSISLFWCAMLIGRVLCAFIPERVSYRRVISVQFLCGMAALGSVGLARSWPWALGLFLLCGFCFSGTWPSIVAMAGARFPRRSGTVVGVTIASGALGCVIITPLMKTLWGLVPYYWIFPAVASGYVLGFLFLAFLPSMRGMASTQNLEPGKAVDEPAACA